MKRPCWPLTAVLFLGFARVASGDYISGRLVVRGDLPDIIFREGTAADKTVSFVVKNTGFAGVNYNIFARSASPAIKIFATYAAGASEPTPFWRAYPYYARIADSFNVSDGDVTVNLAVRYNGGTLGQWPSIKIGVNNSVTDLTEPPTYIPYWSDLGTVDLIGISASDSVPSTTFIATCTSSTRHPTYPHGFYVEHPLLNGSPNALFQITPIYNPPGVWPGVLNNHPTGIWYNSAAGKWEIFNEDWATMPLGAAFTVKIDRTALVHEVTSANIAGVQYQYSRIWDERINDNPNALVYVTPLLVSTYQTSPVGVYYDGSRWAVMNHDQAAMTHGSKFVVSIIGRDATTGTFPAYAHNWDYWQNQTYLGNPTSATNQLIVTPNYNPNGYGAAANPHFFSLWYTGSVWTIFNQNSANMTNSPAFNVWLPTPAAY